MDYFKSLYETKEQPKNNKQRVQKENLADTYNMTALYDTIVAASTTVASTSATYYEHAVKQATDYFQSGQDEKEQPEGKYGRRPSRDTNQRPTRDLDRYNERNERPSRNLDRYNERSERPRRSEGMPERRPSEPMARSERNFSRSESERNLHPSDRAYDRRGNSERSVRADNRSGRHSERSRNTEHTRIQPRSQSVHASRQPTLPREKVQSLPSTNWARSRAGEERRERPTRQRSY
ncbi:hypothetical protein HDV01_003236 [Terramyces sp. JEL0728]|nr:hypothetical protein HDV01_003236 [Terramyces sp. JEL0728]